SAQPTRSWGSRVVALIESLRRRIRRDERPLLLQAGAEPRTWVRRRRTCETPLVHRMDPLKVETPAATQDRSPVQQTKPEAGAYRRMPACSEDRRQSYREQARRSVCPRGGIRVRFWLAQAGPHGRHERRSETSLRKRSRPLARLLRERRQR